MLLHLDLNLEELSMLAMDPQHHLVDSRWNAKKKSLAAEFLQWYISFVYVSSTPQRHWNIFTPSFMAYFFPLMKVNGGKYVKETPQ